MKPRYLSEAITIDNIYAKKSADKLSSPPFDH